MCVFVSHGAESPDFNNNLKQHADDLLPFPASIFEDILDVCVALSALSGLPPSICLSAVPARLKSDEGGGRSAVSLTAS